MIISRTGIIVNVGKYTECLTFYKDILNLPIMFQKSEKNFALCCFAFGDSYLMLETGGVADVRGKPIQTSPVKIRFNVENCESALQYLKSKGINARIQHFDWGSNINIFDPDGNRIGIRDEKMFVKDIKEARDAR